MSLFFITPNEMAEILAKKVRAKRLSLNLSQQTFSKRSGVSYGVLKNFERTGKISLESLLKLALSLNCLEEFGDLFELTKPDKEMSLDELMQDKSRKRGRR